MSEEPTVVTFYADGQVTIASPSATQKVDNARLALFYLAGLTCVRPKPIIVREEA